MTLYLHLKYTYSVVLELLKLDYIYNTSLFAWGEGRHCKKISK